MRVLRFVRELETGCRASREPPGAVVGSGSLAIRSATWPADAVVAGRVALAAADDALRVSAAAVAAELRGRTDRMIDGWVGWWTASEPATPVGLVMLCRVPGGGTSIPWLFVDRGFRRRGIAAALVAVALERARRLGARRVTVESRVDWTACDFWRAVGFHEVARGDRSRGDGDVS